VKPGQGGSEPRLRRSSAGDTIISRKPGRSSSSHTLGPTEPRLDLSKPETRSDQSCATSHPARCRNRANRPCTSRTEINVVLSFQILYLSPFRAPIWTPDLCFVAGPTFWVFWVVIVPVFCETSEIFVTPRAPKRLKKKEDERTKIMIDAMKAMKTAITTITSSNSDDNEEATFGNVWSVN
jgi:hypothetical protein